ncbi:hypothetical protein [Chitinophaga sp. S165]|uniref:hypothetical protein n=1 Tax=Chitinophaga sp. S165 TaxID=2135462 RepID=UPI000D83B196|nr:hypothetical protein [Chitinophaga sp. S165]PWV56674.1 hypothetical protein C7475_1011191 [Chitinophaga sp. S165]
MDYLGATGKQRDAVLTIFEGTTSFHQVYANEGFTVEQFKELILAFDDLKAGRYKS